MSLASTPEIIEELKAGRMVVLVDEEDRENEGDLVMAAEFATPDAINFMARYGRGLICLTLTDARCRQLGLKQMVSDNQTPHGTAFTVSIEAAEGVTTGISAADRAVTIQAAVKKDAQPTDIIQPGHIFPLRAQPGGVLVRAGHTEAGCDLAALAGLEPASVICEILKDDGSMARLPDLIPFAQEHGLKIGAIADLIHYRNQTESLVERVAERPIETAYGAFRLIAYRDSSARETHLALVKGDIHADEETLVRVHEPLSVMDFLDVTGGRHSWPIPGAMARIAGAPSGVLVLLHRPETADALLGRINPAPVSERKVDLRDYGIGAQILRDLGVGKMKLLASPRKMPAMDGFGLEVTGYLDRM
ncbi:MAG: 3,4-dihydroxy-2-butanone-4-phosphate synthase [Hydrogenophilales bacterium 16-64-46]|nr:MAG: 3,4-dihydroxy-2-butanone-4-phosphate synthase [Hydrogenophilales bacterium 12-64-13]OYZ06230.1 MAG: 3,4-dihydroxy-2-butanone-4-phosphate synthase [Hydrogenophilales bacterium 16-64-46]OZA38871.1 MAG: 3,4-dihydroxy-2-butanone-4-phosphate synthase [Hydrogenophilales bacterium 17-64-34]HQS99485.1 bifunctional 3,4-dihydroxy-2-butanone-4-phosphate synthase/GTP cyclohydrolase II [Thiobacillus sp.]